MNTQVRILALLLERDHIDSKGIAWGVSAFVLGIFIGTRWDATTDYAIYIGSVGTFVVAIKAYLKKSQIELMLSEMRDLHLDEYRMALLLLQDTRKSMHIDR